MRELIQENLNSIIDLECGPEISDELLVEEKNYFHYSISENYVSNNFERKNNTRLSFVGYLKRKKKNTENTPLILDKKTDEIIGSLKRLNFRCSSDDVSVSEGISKVKISGYVYYSEINNDLY